MLGEFAESGLVNIVGGCCGTTPAHIAQIAAAVRGHAPASVVPATRPPGSVDWSRSRSAPDTGFVMIGERTNVTGSRGSVV